MAIFMLSLAGIPPLAGFFGKFYLFSAALRAGENYGLLWLVALALFGSFVSLYYYLIVLKAIFVDQPSLRSFIDRSLVTRSLQRITVSVLAAAIISSRHHARPGGTNSCCPVLKIFGKKSVLPLDYRGISFASNRGSTD